MFNHEADAWDDYQARFDAGDDDPTGYYGSNDNHFFINRLYHHRRVTYKEIIERREKAILFRTNFDQTIWVPLSLCRQIKDTDCYIWKGFNNLEAFFSKVNNHGQQLLPRSPGC